MNPDRETLDVLMDSLEATAGLAAAGILFDFGSRYALSFVESMQTEISRWAEVPVLDHSTWLELYLERMRDHKLFSSCSVKEQADGWSVILEQGLELERAGCHLLRGLLRSLAQEVVGSHVQCTEAHSVEGSCYFLLERR